MKQRPEAGEGSPGAQVSSLPRGSSREVDIKEVHRLGRNAVSPLMSQARRNGEDTGEEYSVEDISSEDAERDLAQVRE